MTRFWYSIVFLIFTASCSGDIDRVISTDLLVEGNEIFGISLALEESLFYSFQTLENYRQADTLSLPGCPNVMINENEKTVTLEFLSQRECPSRGPLPKKGKIHIKYLTSTNVLESTTRLEYEDYEVRGFKLEGFRDFKQIRSIVNPNRRTETFEDILIINKTGSSTRLKGNFEHNLIFTLGNLAEFTTSGSLEGRNITGRQITMQPNTTKRFETKCIYEGLILPAVGSETWQIFRNETQAVTHKLDFEKESDCSNKATITLHDGRIMVFRQ
jgi:hypothetical protein